VLLEYYVTFYLGKFLSFFATLIFSSNFHLILLEYDITRKIYKQITFIITTINNYRNHKTLIQEYTQFCNQHIIFITLNLNILMQLILAKSVIEKSYIWHLYKKSITINYVYVGRYISRKLLFIIKYANPKSCPFLFLDFNKLTNQGYMKLP